MINVDYDHDSGAVRFRSDGITILIQQEAVTRATAHLGVTAAQPATVATPVVLEEEHPMWDHYSGGDRQGGLPWEMPAALEDAKALRRHLTEMGSAFFEMLLAEPGRLFTSQEIMDAHPMFKSASVLAGCLNGFSKPAKENGRPFPFYWWEGKDGNPTRYAVRPSVATVFLAAGD